MYRSTTTTLSTGWRVVRSDLASYGWTDADRDFTLDGITYRASQGLAPTAVHSTQTFAANTLDVTAFLDVSTEQEILAGVWDQAEVAIFEYDWSSPPTVFGPPYMNVLRFGNVGQIRRQNNVFTAEIRGLGWRLSRQIGRAYSPTCPWRHAQWNRGTQTYVAAVECGITLTTFIKTGTVTAVDAANPTLIFTGSNVQADDYFAEGYVTFTSGDNANVTREVRIYESGEFTLYRPFPFEVDIGDAWKAVRGDDKTAATCQATFNNLVNFGGFPHLPGLTQVYKNPIEF